MPRHSAAGDAPVVVDVHQAEAVVARQDAVEELAPADGAVVVAVEAVEERRAPPPLGARQDAVVVEVEGLEAIERHLVVVIVAAGARTHLVTGEDAVVVPVVVVERDVVARPLGAGDAAVVVLVDAVEAHVAVVLAVVVVVLVVLQDLLLLLALVLVLALPLAGARVGGRGEDEGQAEGESECGQGLTHDGSSLMRAGTNVRPPGPRGVRVQRPYQRKNGAARNTYGAFAPVIAA